ncbi:MAG TPA: fibronectin type III domain-containing protein [Symbiobacteriaceae bacterium]
MTIGAAAAAAVAVGAGAFLLIKRQNAGIPAAGGTLPMTPPPYTGSTPVTPSPVIPNPITPLPPSGTPFPVTPPPVTPAPSLPTLPAAPTGVSVTGISTSAVRVAWQPVPGAALYRVIHPAYQSTPEQVVATTIGTSVDIAGLAWNSPYSVSIEALNAAGAGPRSALARGSTLG